MVYLYLAVSGGRRLKDCRGIQTHKQFFNRFQAKRHFKRVGGQSMTDLTVCQVEQVCSHYQHRSLRPDSAGLLSLPQS